MTVLFVVLIGVVLAVLPSTWVVLGAIALGLVSATVHFFGPPNVYIPLLMVATPLLLVGWLIGLTGKWVFHRMRAA